MAERCIKCQEEIDRIYSVCRRCAEEFLSDNIFGVISSPLITSPPMDRYKEDSNPLLGIGERPDGELIYQPGQEVLEEVKSIQVEDMDEDDYRYVERRMNTILAEIGVPKQIDFEKYLFSKAETKVFSELFYKLEAIEKTFSEQSGNASLYLRIANLFHYNYQRADVGLFEPEFREEMKKDYLEKAEGYYQLSSEADDGSIYPLRNRAFLLLDAGDPEKAKEYFQKAVFTGDEDLKTRLGVVEASIKMGELEEAKEDLEPLKEEGEKNPRFWFLKGEIARKEDRWGRAIQFYDNSLENQEGFIPAMLEKADLLRERGWGDDARVFYNNILKLDEENLGALEGMADLYIQKEDHEEAIGWLDEILAIDPQKKDIWVKKAESLRELENYDGAMESYENALKVDSDLKSAIEGKKEIEEKTG